MKINKSLIFLILILIVSIVANQFVIDTKWYSFLPKFNKEAIEISLVFFIYIIGFFSLRNGSQKWKSLIWSFIYLFAIGAFVVAAIADAYFNYSTSSGRFRFFSIKEFLYGPIPYLLIYVSGKFSLNLSNRDNQK